VIKLPKKKVQKHWGDVPPTWFNVMTVILVIIAFGFLAWTVVCIAGCANSSMVEYAKYKNPGCDVIKVTEKRCGTEIVLQCPLARFETICLSENR
jgi:hypothetical protein